MAIIIDDAIGAAITAATAAVERFHDSIHDFAKACAEAALDNWKSILGQPEYPEPKLLAAQVPGGRSACAALARGKLARWRSLNEKRIAWGFR